MSKKICPRTQSCVIAKNNRVGSRTILHVIALLKTIFALRRANGRRFIFNHVTTLFRDCQLVSEHVRRVCWTTKKKTREIMTRPKNGWWNKQRFTVFKLTCIRLQWTAVVESVEHIPWKICAFPVYIRHRLWARFPPPSALAPVQAHTEWVEQNSIVFRKNWHANVLFELYTRDRPHTGPNWTEANSEVNTKSRVLTRSKVNATRLT